MLLGQCTASIFSIVHLAHFSIVTWLSTDSVAEVTQLGCVHGDIKCLFHGRCSLMGIDIWDKSIFTLYARVHMSIHMSIFHMTVFYTSLFMIFKSFCLALWAARQAICLPWVDMYSKIRSSFFPNKADRQMHCSLERFFLTAVFQGHFTCRYVFFSLHTYKESSLSVK